MEDNYAKIKKIRNKNKCLFEGVKGECKSQGKNSIEKNHLISKASYLERIADNNKVLVFDFENRSYSSGNRKLSERNIKNANVFQVLCGFHDKLLFSEIENSMEFNENNVKQLSQFALRAFLFSHSEEQLKSNFDNIVNSFENRVADAHLAYGTERLEKYKSIVKNEMWDEVETHIIRIKKQIYFISCFSIAPYLGLFLPIRFSGEKISFNIFPEKNETIILLSHLKGRKFKGAKRYCDRLCALSRNNEKFFLEYMNKFIIAFDHNICINPSYWNQRTQEEKNDFYAVAHLFPSCKTFGKMLILLIKLKYQKYRIELIS